MAEFTFNFRVEEEDLEARGCTDQREEATEPLDSDNKEQPPCCDSSIKNQTENVGITDIEISQAIAKEITIDLSFHEELLDHVTPLKYQVPNSGLQILYADVSNASVDWARRKHVAQTSQMSRDCPLPESESELAPLVKLSNCSHSDLIPGVYEGGLKVWECAFDLVEYLAKSEIQFSSKRVLELGCGAGLPAIFALMKGAGNVHFQDYNPQVIDYITIPSVLLNMKSLSDFSSLDSSLAKYGCKFYSGDWSSLIELVPSGHYDIILTSETIYSPTSQPKLLAALKYMLHPNDGVAFVAAKSYYFGVGGSIGSFIEHVEGDGGLSVDKCYVVDCEIPREILMLKSHGLR